MDVPSKIRLLGRIRKVFPEWAIRKQAGVIYASFNSDLKKARDWEHRKEIEAERGFATREYWDALSELRSRKLVGLAHQFHIETAGVTWVTGRHGNRFLDEASETKLYRAIQDKRRALQKFRNKIIRIIVGIIVVIIGLVYLWHTRGQP
jgi:uncharacterized membrane protein YvbJ